MPAEQERSQHQARTRFSTTCSTKGTVDRWSGTGRGKEIKKGRGSARNWGSETKLVGLKEVLSSRDRKMHALVTEETKEEPAVEDAPDESPAVEIVEEEDKTLSYDEYMKIKARPDNEMFAPPKEREVENEFANLKPAVAVEEDFLVMGGAKGNKKKGVRNVEKKTIEVGFRVADPNATADTRSRGDGDNRRSGRGGGRGGGRSDRSSGRGDRSSGRGDRSSGRGDRSSGRGRGGGRGRGPRGSGRGGGSQKENAMNINDSDAFPSL